MSIVEYLRESLVRQRDVESVQPVEEWFVDSNEHRHHVSIKSMESHADRSYEKWMALDPRISHSCDLRAKLVEWITVTPLDEIISRLAEPIGGCGATGCHSEWEFTPHQVLAMVLWIDPPVNVQVVATIPTEALHQMVGYMEGEGNRRKIPIQSTFGMLKGVCAEATILDLPTSGGKTAMSLAMAFLALSTRRFDQMKEMTRIKRGGSIFPGSCDLPIARLCIVASGGTTFDHFEETLGRLIPGYLAKHPDQKVVVWTTMSARHSVRKALDATADGGTVIFWCIPMKETNKVLRTDPDVSVAIMITDEYTTDPPRERSRTCKSPILHHLLLQATPQSLVGATEGYKSWLSDLMGGVLHAPSSVARYVKYRRWTEAQLALDQACKLKLMTMTFLREGIRDDLRAMMPNGMDVYTIRSRSMTLASQINNSQVDMVPADLSVVLLLYLSSLKLSDEAIVSIRALSGRVFTIKELIDVVQGVTSRDPDIVTETNPTLLRLMERIREASTQCPVCLEGPGVCKEEEDCLRPKVFGCCGYVVCSSCFESVDRCPFCRAPVPDAIPRSMVPEVVEAPGPDVINLDSDDEEVVDEGRGTLYYPARPRFVEGSEMNDDVRRLTSPEKKQVDNLVNVLHILKRHHFDRVLLVVECSASQLLSANLNDYIHVSKMGSVTGFQINRVDKLLSGKGGEFAKLKRRFDDPSEPPQVLFCYGVQASFLYGTDLGRATALVAVGDIGSGILTQAMGRVFRAVKHRDATVPIKVFKIYTGHTNMRRRRRGDDSDFYEI